MSSSSFSSSPSFSFYATEIKTNINTFGKTNILITDNLSEIKALINFKIEISYIFNLAFKYDFYKSFDYCKIHVIENNIKQTYQIEPIINYPNTIKNRFCSKLDNKQYYDKIWKNINKNDFNIEIDLKNIPIINCTDKKELTAEIVSKFFDDKNICYDFESDSEEEDLSE